MEFVANEGKKVQIEVDGEIYLRHAIKTRFVKQGDDYMQLFREYVSPLYQEGDLVSSSEKIIALCQNRVVRRDDIKIGWLAKFLAKFASQQNRGGYGVGMPINMQYAMNKVGALRVLVASIASGITKLFGIKGVFYQIVGQEVAGLDGFYDGAWEQYRDIGIEIPENPNEVCNEIKEKLGISMMIVDSNDFGQEILGKSEDIVLDEAHLKQLIKDNPAGQGRQQTPLILIRKKRRKRCRMMRKKRILRRVIFLSMMIIIMIVCTKKLHKADFSEHVEEDYQEVAENLVVEKEPKEINDWRLTLVNYENVLPENYEMELVNIDKIRKIDARVFDELHQMLEHMKQDGITNVWVQSAYRSVERQEDLFERKIKEYMEQGNTREQAEILALQAINKPGTSEHNLGLAVDFNYVKGDFDTTKGFAWLMEHAEEYGFVLRYRKEKETITKVEYEPWHWRYVGKEHAVKMNELGMCLEEYVQYLRQQS